MSSADNRVAVVVFLSVDDEDDRIDRQHTAELAVRQALTAAGDRDGRNLTLPACFLDNTESTATVHNVVELGRAMRSGYVSAWPTPHAYPRETTT
ncbi:hypothetical protein ACH347_34825 [Saccharopolyspora sp. 5N102]|uniref:hypothetical protein n=1 Tax=Saccharopolyspora sp. 5N102 TaxID=3375155 RepID=UPI003797D931